MLDVIAVISFCIAFFAGGYCLGRLADARRMWFVIDPDPLREDAEVVSIHTARSRLPRARAS